MVPPEFAESAEEDHKVRPPPVHLWAPRGSSLLLAPKILLNRFLHYGAQRNVLRLRQRPAIFIFRSVVGNTAIHVSDLDPHLAPGRVHRFPASRKCLPLFLASTYAQSRG